MPTYTYTDLKLVGEEFHRLQEERKSSANRLRTAGAGTFAAEILRESVAAFEGWEKQLSKHMQAIAREVFPPRLLQWQEESKGIGLHLLARLLGELGDPITAHPKWWEGEGKERHLVEGQPFVRTPQQWFRYAGYGDPNDRRRKGMTKEEVGKAGRPLAKALLRELVKSIMKHSSPQYRPVYDHWKAVYATRQNEKGEDWTLIHQHNAAMRKVARAMLMDIWLTAQGLEPTYGTSHQPGKYRTRA